MKPGVTWNCVEPLALASPCTSAGAATGTARRAIGERTVCEAPSVHVSEPLAHSSNAAVVRENVTVKVLPQHPARASGSTGVTAVLNPGTLADAV